MSGSKSNREHASHASAKHGCCGEDHAKDQKAKPDQKETANPCVDRKHGHAHQSGGDSGCCGGDKTSK